MKTRALSIDGAWEFTPVQFADERGAFLESYRADVLADTISYPLNLKQGNTSISRRGVIRGIHFADVPPSQAKYVTCLRGSALDVVLDIRVGSPTFGRWDTVLLDDVDRRAVYVAEGLGHAFMALTDDTIVTYLCSEPYAPAREHGVHPLDPAIAIAWPEGVTPILSPKDEATPSLAEAQRDGLLPTYEDCVALYADLRTNGKA
jgi:dTDP-4-dehydrorhamnose 3,5-epimerase